MKMYLLTRRHLMVIASIILIISFSFIKYEKTVATFAIPITNKVIIIDPGHGGVDGGASSRDGTTEADINLNIALKLAKYIETGGGVALLTRDSDTGLYTDKSKTIRQKKNEDLKNRKKIAEESEGDIFISIHLNSFEQRQYYGAQTFYPSGHNDSLKLAQIIQEELRIGLDKDNNRKANENKRDLLIMRNVKLPTVLIECGFLSNDREAELLKDKTYQDKIAMSIYSGLIKFFTEAEKGKER